MFEPLLTALSASPPVLAIVAGCIGLCVGSFLNVVIYRMPKRLHYEWRTQSLHYLSGDGQAASAPALADSGDDAIEPPPGLAFPPSHCPSCNTRLRVIDNIPVFSYLLLRGRCAHCAKKISLRYPAVEVLTAVLTILIADHFGVSLQTIVAALLTWLLITLSFIDLDEKLLPDDLTLPGLWLGLLVNLFGVLTDITSAVIGAIAGYLMLWSVYQAFRVATGKEGMGYGDFKLLAMIGAWLGWQILPLVIIVSAVSGTIVGVFMIVSGRQKRGQHMPFGPYLAAGGFVALIWGASITQSYLRMNGW